MILITGATGHFGKATIDFLLKKTFRQTTLLEWLDILRKPAI